MMESAFESLVTLLEEQKEVYGDLLRLGKTKQADLIKGAIEEVDAVTRQEEALIFQAGRLEEERYNCAFHLLEMNGHDPDAPLTEIIEIAPQQVKDRLAELHGEMVNILTELDRLNQENMSLIQQSLKFIQVTVEAISPADQTTYAPDRDVKIEALSRLLDKKV